MNHTLTTLDNHVVGFTDTTVLIPCRNNLTKDAIVAHMEQSINRFKTVNYSYRVLANELRVNFVKTTSNNTLCYDPEYMVEVTSASSWEIKSLATFFALGEEVFMWDEPHTEWMSAEQLEVEEAIEDERWYGNNDYEDNSWYY